jgi:hypothetical protein
MKALFFSFILLLSSLCGLSSSFVNDDMRQLLTVMEVSNDGTLPSIVETTQKKWIRPAGKERWEIENTLSSVQAKAIMDFCQKNRFFSEIKPAHKNYEYAVILGATVSRMEKRIAFLQKIADSGIHFKQVVLLSGARPLDSKVEKIPGGCKTEGEAMESLWKACFLSKQVAWRHFEHPMITTSDGKVRRPTTADTFLLWMANKPQPGSCFMVSDQPYCLYQQFIAEATLPQEFKFETVGSAADPSEQNPVVMLDTIARCLYVISQK